MKYSTNIIAVCFLLISCSQNPETANAQQKISQFERAGLCDFLIDKSGTYHTVFQESPDNGKPIFIYYATSTNKGASWSKPVTISNDNTGNGSGYPRILQDGSGQIYALWKRYGNTTSKYAIPSVILDGPGGYTCGTLFYKVLSGGSWSNAVQLNEVEGCQNSWFATLNTQGNVQVFWTQPSWESVKNNWLTWYYCDFLRTVSLNGTNRSAFTDLNTPTPPAYAGGAPASKEGVLSMNGYIDKTGSVHFISEDELDGVQQIQYYDGKSQRVVYSYPKYNAGNTFRHPPKLLVDEKGQDHLVFRTSAATLESEQIWDINLITNQTNVLASIQKQGVKIVGFQANQGPNGAMAITFEAGTLSGNTEAFGLYYANGTWKNVGLTNNASKEKFFSKDFIGLGGYRTNISMLTKYNSEFGTVAYDGAGRKSMLMTIAAYSVGYGISNPSLVFIPIDK
jgi:hypothetical protein